METAEEVGEGEEDFLGTPNDMDGSGGAADAGVDLFTTGADGLLTDEVVDGEAVGFATAVLAVCCGVFFTSKVTEGNGGTDAAVPAVLALPA